MFIKNNKLFIQEFFKNLKLRTYIFTVIFVEIVAVYLSYKNLFNYEGCTNVVPRNFILFNNFFTIEYPEMCDEQFYFHGFQWINHIYENGYVYQDRPLYLGFGFLIYRLFFIITLLFGFQADPISLLLFSTLIFQVLIVNFIATVICYSLKNRFERFYFLIFFLIVIFSFEQRLYLFLPSNSTTYLFIFAFSIYSIKNKKLNGLVYGILFTISAYGIIGFLYQTLGAVLEVRKNYKIIIKNLILFSIPYLSFELIRILLGIFQGKEYGIRYIHAAEAVEYQQFVWIIKTIFDKSYEPFQSCHTLSNFFSCYIEITKSYISISGFYILICSLLFLFYSFKRNNIKDKTLIIIFSITFFNYIFLSFQGFYAYRFVYYSIGFGLILLTCFFVYKINSDLISILIVISLASYTLSRYKLEEFNLNLNTLDILFLIVISIFLIFDVLKMKKNKLLKN